MTRSFLLLALLFALAEQAFAQIPVSVVLTEIRAACLRFPVATAPRYPDADSDHAGGVVRAKLTFDGIDVPPHIDVFTNTAGEGFKQAVVEFVKDYRLLCDHPRQRSLTLTQEFQFLGTRRGAVLSGGLRRSGDALRADLECTSHLPPPPSYPLPGTYDRRTSGGVLAQLTFTSSTEPPKVDVIAGASSRFATTVRRHAAGYRLVCAGGMYPIVSVVPYTFRLEGEPRYDFRPVGLKDFLALVETIDSERVRFDFTSMGCPFEVSYEVWQPEVRNRALGDGSRGDDRREFLAWLAGLRLKLPEPMKSDLTGQTLKVSVPCLTLNLL